MESSIMLNNNFIPLNMFFVPFPMIVCFFPVPLLTAGISVFLISNQFHSSFCHCCEVQVKFFSTFYLLFLTPPQNIDYSSHLIQNGSFGRNLIKF